MGGMRGQRDLFNWSPHFLSGSTLGARTPGLCHQTDLACFQGVPRPLLRTFPRRMTALQMLLTHLEAWLGWWGLCVDRAWMHVDMYVYPQGAWWSRAAHRLWPCTGGWPAWEHLSLRTPGSPRQATYLNGWHVHTQSIGECILNWQKV